MSIKVNLNLIKKWELREWRKGREGLEGEALDRWDAAFSVKVIEDWPFDQPQTETGYMALGLVDQFAIDNAVGEALTNLGKK